jgi:hypothetical protein
MNWKKKQRSYPVNSDWSIAMIKISPEYSALPNAKKPNPMLQKAIEYLAIQRDFKSEMKVADQGFGALRHLKLMLESYDQIYLIDTKEQFNRAHTIDGAKTTIPTYISNLKLPNKQISLMTNTQFSRTSLELDAVYNMCTFDVALPKTRVEMLRAAKRNLKEGGYFVLIIPRNDTTILCRCKDDNKYLDGYYFKHHGIYTFYTNFRNYDGLMKATSGFGFNLIKDLSIYRQICLILALKQ